MYKLTLPMRSVVKAAYARNARIHHRRRLPLFMYAPYTFRGIEPVSRFSSCINFLIVCILNTDDRRPPLAAEERFLLGSS